MSAKSRHSSPPVTLDESPRRAPRTPVRTPAHTPPCAPIPASAGLERRSREPSRPGRLSRSQCAALEAYIDAHLQETITRGDMAVLFDMGVWTFGRQVRRTLGCTAYALVGRRRIERAAALLRDGALPLKEVAACCGFSDQAHMTRSFRARVGVPPGAYRKAFGSAS